MKRQPSTPKPPGRVATAASRVRQAPSVWLDRYKQGRDEGWERADRARAEYQETRNRYLAAEKAREDAREAPERETRTPKGRTR